MRLSQVLVAIAASFLVASEALSTSTDSNQAKIAELTPPTTGSSTMKTTPPKKGVSATLYWSQFVSVLASISNEPVEKQRTCKGTPNSRRTYRWSTPLVKPRGLKRPSDSRVRGPTTTKRAGCFANVES
ncbi:hypothetical protein PR003_g9284 [Phytophthora rubi]|uniref:RxLR effector protein n=1 Tax=Phytophthora rubi TaxID=129364 RepID=A0A6A4FSS5_9STRA|nr:hypothetical protein PR001_g8646 [Phytophthora rubi]KAE9342813.1 hypothetical protein PR003_g9284 [Phytophthora rubi]